LHCLRGKAIVKTSVEPAVISGSTGIATARSPPPMADDVPVLTPRQRAVLLALARRAIRERVRGVVSAAAIPADPFLREPGAAFVTLTKGGALRGCIGFVRPVHTLAETIRHCAEAAAVSDPRFPPVAADELCQLALEISVLSPVRRIDRLDEIEVGVHGLYVSQGGRHGLLLPQVATEYGWDRDTFLSHVCLKAGLPGDAWRHGAEIQIFTVDHFSDGRPVEPPPGMPHA
jgi:AmmeMemoRadiSam system protein A